jgi:hypothetical protein
MAENGTRISVKRVKATLQKLRCIKIVARAGMEQGRGRQLKNSGKVQRASNILLVSEITNPGIFGLIASADLCCTVCRRIIRNNDLEVP